MSDNPVFDRIQGEINENDVRIEDQDIKNKNKHNISKMQSYNYQQLPIKSNGAEDEAEKAAANLNRYIAATEPVSTFGKGAKGGSGYGLGKSGTSKGYGNDGYGGDGYGYGGYGGKGWNGRERPVIDPYLENRFKVR